jgi:peptidoglycan/xylan/chitin deacetylase (PgdA/CDA1 family)
LPQHAVLLTFDDAYKSLLDGASRCLGEFNYPAVVFTPTQFVGGSNEFDRKFNQPAEAICTWDDLRELDRRGFSVQSHGANHLSFGSLNPEQQEKELRESKAIIEAEVRKPVELFAYPFGHVPGDQQAMCELLERVGYRSAFCFGGGVGTIPNPRRYFLPRVDIYPGDDLANKLGS